MELKETLPILIVVIQCLAGIFAGILLGNGVVYFFNKMPAKWFCNEGEAPEEALMDPCTQRIKSYPWKLVFSMLFTCIGIYLMVNDWHFALASLATLWILTEIAISDIKYRIIPDQLVILLAVTAVGFINYHFGWQDCLLGAAAGLGIMLAIAATGWLLWRRPVLGGGDVKLFAALGLVSGLSGILLIMGITALISAVGFLYFLIQKKVRKTDALPLAPYIAAAAGVYLLFLYGKDFDLLL